MNTPHISSDQALRLDHQLCFALYSASLAMTKLYKPLLDEIGLTYPQYLAMLALWERDGATVSELGERLHLDTVEERVEHLRRLRDVQDERRVLIRLTAAGRRLKTRAARIPGCVLQATQCGVSEALALTQQVQALRDRLSA